MPNKWDQATRTLTMTGPYCGRMVYYCHGQECPVRTVYLGIKLPDPTADCTICKPKCPVCHGELELVNEIPGPLP